MPQNNAGIRPVVLVVEDEALVRWQAVAMIEEAGFEVIEATGADEAIAILEQQADIRLVFTDIQMPGSIDGLRLAHLVRTRWPPVHVIVTSGEIRPGADDLPKAGRYIAKPYAGSDLAGTMWELMGE